MAVVRNRCHANGRRHSQRCVRRLLSMEYSGVGYGAHHQEEHGESVSHGWDPHINGGRLHRINEWPPKVATLAHWPIDQPVAPNYVHKTATESARSTVPKISEFFGIAIYVYWREHGPPPFHAVYGGEEALRDLAFEVGE